MKFKAIAVIAAATALSFGMAGSVAASPLTAKAKPAPQVTGARLQSALLPASSFGGGFNVTQRLNTGKKFWSSKGWFKPANLSCVKFEEYIYVGGFGDTAGAMDSVSNPSPALSDYPSISLASDQAVIQFKTAQAATTFYNEAYARYAKCAAFTESFPADATSLELTTQSLTKTTVKKHKAFQLMQYVDIAALPALSFYQSTAVVLAGTNVYTIDNLNGTNDPISGTLLGNLINRVQALYQHH